MSQFSDRMDALRKKAQAFRQAHPDEIPKVSYYETEMLVEDLRVQQIELELQNDELRRVQADLEAARAKYIELYDFAPSGYFTLDENAIIEEVNLTACAMLDITRVELLHSSFLRLIAEPDLQIFNDFKHQLHRGGNQTTEFRLVRKGRATFYAQVSGLATFDGDQPAGFRVTTIDLTRQKQAEFERKQMEVRLNQAQKLESLGIMASGVAHDFNNLLVAILGNSGLVLRQIQPDSEIYHLVKDIESGALRASEITDQILTYAGKDTHSFTTLSATDLISEIKNLLRTSVPKKIKLNYELGDKHQYFYGDATQIRHLILNLVINASEAIADDTGSITIRTSHIEATQAFLEQTLLTEGLQPGPFVCLEVSDTGCGMDDETKTKIFDPFFTTKFTGRGLGLAMVFGTVRRHHGTISIYTKQNFGSTFRILLPAVEDAPVQQPEKTADVDGEKWLGRGTVLVVDDEPSVRQVLTRILKFSGLEVMAAGNGREALAIFEKNNEVIDAVLLDLTMPEMSGAEALAQLRVLSPDVPVIILSGYNENDVLSRISKRAVSGFIHKPYKAIEVTQKLRVVLEEASSKVLP